MNILIQNGKSQCQKEKNYTKILWINIIAIHLKLLEKAKLALDFLHLKEHALYNA